MSEAYQGCHPSHETRFSDASTFDTICVFCGATDQVPGGWGALAYPCRVVEARKQKLTEILKPKSDGHSL